MEQDKDFCIDDAECTHRTDKALLIEADMFDGPTWVPVSQIRDSSEVLEVGDGGTLIVSRWLAEQKGWL
jgi:hypothetical protein